MWFKEIEVLRLYIRMPNWKFSIVNDFLFHALDRNCRIQLILLTIVKKHKLFIAQLVRRRLTTHINKPIHNGEIDSRFLF